MIFVLGAPTGLHYWQGQPPLCSTIRGLTMSVEYTTASESYIIDSRCWPLQISIITQTNGTIRVTDTETSQHKYQHTSHTKLHIYIHNYNQLSQELNSSDITLHHGHKNISIDTPAWRLFISRRAKVICWSDPWQPVRMAQRAWSVLSKMVSYMSAKKIWLYIDAPLTRASALLHRKWLMHEQYDTSQMFTKLMAGRDGSVRTINNASMSPTGNTTIWVHWAISDTNCNRTA